MSDPTQRWLAQEGTAANPVVSDAAESPATPPPPEPLALTLVSDRIPVHAPAAPVTFPGYEILGELGRGGMGVVYKARQRNLNRLVALKVILGGPLASEEDKARFRVEAEAAARLHHPNIVQVYDVGEYAGFSYMALELVEGQTLRQWQDGKPIDPKHAARLVAELARAIHHAHEQGIVHRDIKPANVLLAPVSAAQPELGAPVSAALPTLVASTVTSGSSGSRAAPLTVAPKVTDFGLAKPLVGGHDLTVTGVACGTPNYMAPEQVRGKALGTGVDVYGLGAVLYELLTGRPPFVGTDAPEVMNQILHSEPPNVRKLAPAVPRDLAVIVAKCLEKDPGARYASARDTADDLDRFVAGKPIAARPVGTAERTWRWAKRNPLVAAFLLLSTIGCVVTGTLAVALARSAEDERGARAYAETAREAAEKQRLATEAARVEAETARDGLKGALAATEAAREAAKQEAKRAAEKQQEADAARLRAEENLRVARDVIRVSLRELSNHPRFEEDDFRAARVMLVNQARAFRDRVAGVAPNTPEWLDVIADVSHWLGFLEFLNNNQNEAAAEYRRAADAAGKWAALEPRNPEPRGRQSFSLVNSGNAQVNARRYGEAEKCYREAVKLVDAVVADRPLDAYFRSMSIDAYGQLANVHRIANQPAAWEQAARQQLDRAKALVRACGSSPDALRRIGTASLELAKAFVRNGKPNDADRYFDAAVAVRDELRTTYPTVTRFALDHGAVLLARAGFLNGRGQPDRAAESYLGAVAVFEKVQAAAPSVNAHCTELVTACTQYAEFLRGRGEFPEAEKRYNQALDLANAVIRRAPTLIRARDVWSSAATGRAHLYNATNRHREAAAEWTKLAAEDPDTRFRPRHNLFMMQSLLYAGDYAAASTAADAQMKKDQPGSMWMDMGRVWCVVAKQIESDEKLAPADKLAGAEKALGKSLACLEKARGMGELKKPEVRQWYDSIPDFAPVRGKFDPDKK